MLAAGNDDDEDDNIDDDIDNNIYGDIDNIDNDFNFDDDHNDGCANSNFG